MRADPNHFDNVTKPIRWVIPVLLAVLLPGGVAGQQSTQTRLSSNAIEVTIGGRVQTQFNTTSIDTEAPSQLFIRRARIELDVQVDDRISGALQPEFGNDRVELLDAYLKVDFAPGFEVLAGKAHRPFGRLEQTTSKRMPPIERGLRIRGLQAVDENALMNGLAYSNRDIGLQLRGAPEGAPLGLAYAAGVFRGPLHGQVGDQDSYQFAARVTTRPLPAVQVGAGWSSRDFTDGVGDTPRLRRGEAFEVDLEYGAFAPGFHLLAEVTVGDHDPFEDARFTGAQAWLAYRTRELRDLGAALEPTFRVSHSDTDAPSADVPPGGTLLTPGFNIYLGPLTRIMLNYDVWHGADGSPDAQSFKAMFQVAF